MRDDTVTVDEIEDYPRPGNHKINAARDCCPGHASAPMWGRPTNRPWPEIIDDFLAVEPFDKDAIIDRVYLGTINIAPPEGIITQAIDSTLRDVVQWLNKQGHTAIANDLRRAGDV